MLHWLSTFFLYSILRRGCCVPLKYFFCSKRLKKTRVLTGNTEPSEKRFRMNSFVADFGRPLESERVFSRQIAEESRSLFHFCINEVEHLDKAKPSQKGPGLESNIRFQEVPRSSGTFEEDLNCLTKFNIPNFVNTEQNSSLGEDDLLISEPPIILESKSVMQSSHRILD
nr:melanocortin-2 receptor accessory protein 2 isoform X2 [Anser cygnoides]